MSIDSDLDGMSKSKSNDSQLSVNGRHNGGETPNDTAPIPAPRTRFSIHEECGLFHAEGTSGPLIPSDTLGPPRSPCTPIRAMHHIIQHRFSKKFKLRSTCDLCNKQMFFGFKCTECKYRCHKDCKSSVPPSCGLPKGLLEEFRKTLHNGDGIIPTPSPNLNRIGVMPTKRNEPRHRPPMHTIPFHGADSSSAGSSCNSSSPSSPALLTIPPQTPANKSQFNFPEVSSVSVTKQNPIINSTVPNTIIEDAEFDIKTHSSCESTVTFRVGNYNSTSNIETKLNGSIIDSNGEFFYYSKQRFKPKRTKNRGSVRKNVFVFN